MLLSAVKTFGYVVDTDIGREDYTEEREKINKKIPHGSCKICSVQCLVTVSVKRLLTFLDVN